VHRRDDSSQSSDDPIMFRIDEFDVLGKGSYGVVSRGTLKVKASEVSLPAHVEALGIEGEDGYLYLPGAIKTLNYSTDKERDSILQEIAILKQFSGHPSFMYLYEDRQEVAGEIQIFAEEARGKDLASLIKGGAHHSEREVADFTIGIAEAFQVMHDEGVLHRDIKSLNIFIQEDGRFIIGDVGLAKAIQYSHGETVGTPLNMAPEVVRSEEVSFATDVFATGAMMLEMLLPKSAVETVSGRSFSTPMDLFFFLGNKSENSFSGKYEAYLEKNQRNMSPIMKVLFRMIHPDPVKRMQSMNEVQYALKEPTTYLKSLEVLDALPDQLAKEKKLQLYSDEISSLFFSVENLEDFAAFVSENPSFLKMYTAIEDPSVFLKRVSALSVSPLSHLPELESLLFQMDGWETIVNDDALFGSFMAQSMTHLTALAQSDDPAALLRDVGTTPIVVSEQAQDLVRLFKNRHSPETEIIRGLADPVAFMAKCEAYAALDVDVDVAHQQLLMDSPKLAAQIEGNEVRLAQFMEVSIGDVSNWFGVLENESVSEAELDFMLQKPDAYGSGFDTLRGIGHESATQLFQRDQAEALLAAAENANELNFGMDEPDVFLQARFQENLSRFQPKGREALFLDASFAEKVGESTPISAALAGMTDQKAAGLIKHFYGVSVSQDEIQFAVKNPDVYSQNGLMLRGLDPQDRRRLFSDPELAALVLDAPIEKSEVEFAVLEPAFHKKHFDNISKMSPEHRFVLSKKPQILREVMTDKHLISRLKLMPAKQFKHVVDLLFPPSRMSFREEPSRNEIRFGLYEPTLYFNLVENPQVKGLDTISRGRFFALSKKQKVTLSEIKDVNELKFAVNNIKLYGGRAKLLSGYSSTMKRELFRSSDRAKALLGEPTQSLNSSQRLHLQIIAGAEYENPGITGAECRYAVEDPDNYAVLALKVETIRPGLRRLFFEQPDIGNQMTAIPAIMEALSGETELGGDSNLVSFSTMMLNRFFRGHVLSNNELTVAFLQPEAYSSVVDRATHLSDEARQQLFGNPEQALLTLNSDRSLGEIEVVYGLNRAPQEIEAALAKFEPAVKEALFSKPHWARLILDSPALRDALTPVGEDHPDYDEFNVFEFEWFHKVMDKMGSEKLDSSEIAIIFRDPDSYLAQVAALDRLCIAGEMRMPEVEADPHIQSDALDKRESTMLRPRYEQAVQTLSFFERADWDAFFRLPIGVREVVSSTATSAAEVRFAISNTAAYLDIHDRLGELPDTHRKMLFYDVDTAIDVIDDPKMFDRLKGATAITAFDQITYYRGALYAMPMMAG
ncbi:MAG: serine/threonine protein kinase, partial [Candidatus Marinamargulisbacteria bacterium]